MISPILSNIYLHEVLDTWFADVVKPRLKGHAFMIRYADDAVLVFSCKKDALRVMEVLPKRVGRYGLTLHPEKTQLIDFNKPKTQEGSKEDSLKPATFNFLGFTHFWGRSRKGRWYIRRRTEKSRYSRALKKVDEWCRRNRHRSLKEQYKMLTKKLMGHYSYYGITGNAIWIVRFRNQVERIWRKWLNRRSRSPDMPWERFQRLKMRFALPYARVVHSYCTAKL